jgi:aminoglycoside phosphotransferase (APT) family kinase protein
MSESPKEQALADVRDALSSLHSVPGAPLDEQKHELLREAAENVGSLERALTNELEQEETTA